MITIIAAIGKNRELGKDNKLIWRIKEDMQFFKDNTIGKPIVMGRKTYESLPNKLPNRKHIILTSKNLSLDDDIIVLPGHDARTTIGEERMHNPFL